MTSNRINHIASRCHSEDADIRSRKHGGHSERPGRRRMARYLQKRGMHLDTRFQIANAE